MTTTRPLEHRAGAAAPTLVTALGCALAMTPITAVFGDWMWLLDAWGGLAVVAATLGALRIGRPARMWHDAAAAAVLVGYLVAVHLPANAIAGVIPTGATLNDLAALMDRAHSVIQSSRPGLDSTASIRLLTTAALVSAAIAIDLIAVVGRLRAVAGLPILAIVTCGGAIGRTSIGFFAFVCAGGGYLLVLASGMALERREWTAAAAVHAESRRSAVAGGGSGGRIAAAALTVAILVPAVIPLASDGLLSGMFRGSGGSGDSVSLSAFAKLRGALNQSDPIDLLDVAVTDGLDPGDPSVNPFYLRQIVLDDYKSNSGWSASGSGEKSDLRRSVQQEPAPGSTPGRSFVASIDVVGLDDSTVPTFGSVREVNGLGESWRWNRTTATIGGSRITPGDSYSLRFFQPEPDAALLSTAQVGQGEDFARWLALPEDVPASVRTDAARITGSQTSAYGRALALSDYFTDPVNGFAYDTQIKNGDSGDALADFLEAKTGYCQQYAGAMAVMLRSLNIPARVVLGYTHSAPDADGAFTVTSRDAHAWVEVYFAGIGWLPFDPTPLTGSNASRDIPVPYAPGPGYTTTAPGAAGTADPNAVDDPLLGIPEIPDIVSYDSGPLVTLDDANDTRSVLEYWLMGAALGAGVLLALALVPALARVTLRRRRISAARRAGTVWPWWQEFRAAATDLGQTWPEATTLREAPVLAADALPRQLRRGAVAEAAGRLAVRAERERFGAASASPAVRHHQRSDAERLGRAAVRELQGAYPLRARVAARMWPRSITAPFKAAASRRIRLALRGPRRARARRAG